MQPLTLGRRAGCGMGSGSPGSEEREGGAQDGQGTGNLSVSLWIYSTTLLLEGWRTIPQGALRFPSNNSRANPFSGVRKTYPFDPSLHYQTGFLQGNHFMKEFPLLSKTPA